MYSAMSVAPRQGHVGHVRVRFEQEEGELLEAETSGRDRRERRYVCEEAHQRAPDVGHSPDRPTPFE
jgi:hypothetical protein